MFADAGGFWMLCAFSAITGAMLGVLYDVMSAFVTALFAPKQAVDMQRVRFLGDAKSAERALFPINLKMSANDVARFFADIVFCVLSALVVIVLIFHLNYGEIRAFSLLSALMGFIVYKKTVGRPILFLLSRALEIIKISLKKMACALLFPIVYPIRRLTAYLYSKMKARVIRKRTLKAISSMEENERIRQIKRNTFNERD